MKHILIALICLFLSGCVVVQKTPQSTVCVVDAHDRSPVIAAVVSRKYYPADDFRRIGRTDTDGRILISATYRPMPVPHSKLPVRMMLRIEAEGYHSEEVEVEGIKTDVDIKLRNEN